MGLSLAYKTNTTKTATEQTGTKRTSFYKLVRACQKSVFDTLSNETHFVGLSFEGAAARRSALAVRQRRTTRTFASREVFLPTYMPPAKMF